MRKAPFILLAASICVLSLGSIFPARAQRDIIAQSNVEAPRLTPAQRQLRDRRSAEGKAHLRAAVQRAHQKFLRDRAQFQVHQIDRHVGLLNAALKGTPCRATACHAALSRRMAIDARARSTIATSMQPVSNLSKLVFIPGGTFYGHSKFAGRGGNGSSSCTTPNIQSTSVSAGQPGDPVTITGSGFGSTAGQVYFIVHPGVTSQANVDYWSDTQIITSVPTESGLQSSPGNVYVKTCAQSRALSFQFNPSLDMQQLPIAGHVVIGDWRCLPDSCNSSENGVNGDTAINNIIAGFVSGRRTDDQYFSGFQLKNGWVVSAVSLFNAFVTSSSDGCAVANAGIVGNASPYTDIHCWVSPSFGTAGYSLTFSIQGPLGVAFQ